MQFYCKHYGWDHMCGTCKSEEKVRILEKSLENIIDISTNSLTLGASTCDRISKVARRALDDANEVDIQHMVVCAPDESVSLAEPFPNSILKL